MQYIEITQQWSAPKWVPMTMSEIQKTAGGPDGSCFSSLRRRRKKYSIDHLCSGVIPASLRMFGSPESSIYWRMPSTSPLKADACTSMPRTSGGSDPWSGYGQNLASP